MGRSQLPAISAGVGLNAAVVVPLVIVAVLAAPAMLGMPFGRIPGFDRVKPAYLCRRARLPSMEMGAPRNDARDGGTGLPGLR